MKVLFSNPPWWVKNFPFETEDAPSFAWRSGVRAGSRWPYTVPSVSAPDHFTFGGYLPYPFFMGYAATWVKKHSQAEVTFRDSIALRESYRSYFDFIQENPFEYIFMESATSSWEEDRKLFHQIKELQSDAKIVLTGPIATNWQTILEDEPVHAVIAGEYEKGAVRVINGEKGFIDFDLLSVDEMNNSPFFYMDEQLVNHYYDGISQSVNLRPPELQVWTSRGCPYKCIFCAWPAVMTSNDPDGTHKRRVRQYSGKYIEALVTEYVARFGVKSIYFDDDTFNLGDRHVRDICEVMDKVGLPWAAMCRADTINQETWKMMKDSGCYKVKIGFESGNQWVLDNIVNKRLNLEKARETVRVISDMGIKVHGTFTYGLPGETHAQMLDTKSYISSLKLDSYQESGTAVVDGTPLATLMREKSLEKFKGAKVEDGFIDNSDGAEKIRQLALPDVEGSTGSGASFGVAAAKDDRKIQAIQQYLIKLTRNLSRDDKVGLWGLNEDFVDIMLNSEQIKKSLKHENVFLFDRWSAGQNLDGKLIQKPECIRDFDGVILLVPRNSRSRESMKDFAKEVGVSTNQLIDPYDGSHLI